MKRALIGPVPGDEASGPDVYAAFTKYVAMAGGGDASDPDLPSRAGYC